MCSDWSNGLLLRSDVHTLYDRGQLGVDLLFRPLSSPRLCDEFGTGRTVMQGKEYLWCYRGRRADRPNRELLEWHPGEAGERRDSRQACEFGQGLASFGGVFARSNGLSQVLLTPAAGGGRAPRGRGQHPAKRNHRPFGLIAGARNSSRPAEVRVTSGLGYRVARGRTGPFGGRRRT